MLHGEKHRVLTEADSSRAPGKLTVCFSGDLESFSRAPDHSFEYSAGDLKRENSLLIRRVDELIQTLKSAVSAGDSEADWQKARLLALREEVKHLRALLRLQNPHHNTNTSEIVFNSPTPSASSILLTTPPCSPRVPPPVKNVSVKVMTPKPVEVLDSERVSCEPSLIISDVLLNDITDVGPPLSPPGSRNTSPKLCMDDPEIDICDKADLKTGTSEVDNDLENDIGE